MTSAKAMSKKRIERWAHSGRAKRIKRKLMPELATQETRD